jgi:hypothetical protein
MNLNLQLRSPMARRDWVITAGGDVTARLANNGLTPRGRQ